MSKLSLWCGAILCLWVCPLAEAASGVRFEQTCHAYVRDFFGATFFEPSLTWRSHHLSGVALSSPSAGGPLRAAGVVRHVFAPNSAIVNEASPFLKAQFLGNQEWEKYAFRALEILNYGDGFSRAALQLDLSLPSQGKFLHLAGATGALSGLLTRSHPGRRFVVLDSDSAAFVSIPRWQGVLPPDMRPEFRSLTLDLTAAGETQFDGALGTFVTTRVSPSGVGVLMPSLYRALRRGGRAVFIEPVAGREALWPEWVAARAAEAVVAGAPHNGFDLALAAMVLSGKMPALLYGNAPALRRYMPAEAFRALGYNAGFRLISESETGDGVTRKFIFEKPGP